MLGKSQAEAVLSLALSGVAGYDFLGTPPSHQQLEDQQMVPVAEVWRRSLVSGYIVRLLDRWHSQVLNG